MKRYEYRVITGNMIAKPPRNLQWQIDELAKQGWTVLCCSSASEGSMFYVTPATTVILQREVAEQPSAT
jgi:hypothetical protein